MKLLDVMVDFVASVGGERAQEIMHMTLVLAAAVGEERAHQIVDAIADDLREELDLQAETSRAMAKALASIKPPEPSP